MKKRIFFLLIAALVLSGITAYGYWTDRVDIKAQISAVYKPDILIGDGMGGSSGSKNANVGSQAPPAVSEALPDPSAQEEPQESAEASDPMNEAGQPSESTDSETSVQELPSDSVIQEDTQE